MYPDYPPYPPTATLIYPPPPPPTRRRPSVVARVAVSGLFTLLTVAVALLGVGLFYAPQLLAQTVPLAATHVSGSVYGEDLAQRVSGRDGVTTLAGAAIDCGASNARADAAGHFALTLLKGRHYNCSVSAAQHVSVTISLAPQLQGAYRLDLGPALSLTPAAQTAQNPPNCAITATSEVCPALALRAGALSGQVTDSRSYAPIAHAAVLCWDNSAVAQTSASLPASYNATTDAQGHYMLTDTPPGPYLCVADRQGAPQRAQVTPAGVTTINFVACSHLCGGLTYHGGPVMHAFTAYVIFWAPSGVSLEPGGGSNARFQSLVRQYLADVGGTRFYGLLTQYWDQSGPVRNVATLGGAYFDQQPYPHAGTRADPLSDDDITAEISRVRGLKGWSVTPNTGFILLTGYNVQECAKFSNGQACSFPTSANNGFCAYHSFTPYYSAESSQNYAPYLYAANNNECSYLPTFDTGPAPYGDQAADAVINSLSHEQFEMVTDPETRGWYDGDPSGGEIGDKCETNFGATDANGATVTLSHGHGYVLQSEYSDRASGCAYQ